MEGGEGRAEGDIAFESKDFHSRTPSAVILSHIKMSVLIWVSLYYVSLCVCSPEPGGFNLTMSVLAGTVLLEIALENKHQPEVAIVVVKERGPLSFKFYSCAGRARCAGCCELRIWKILPILFMQIRFKVMMTKLFQNLS